MTILGALVYSAVHPASTGAVSYPQFVTWQAGDIASILLAAAMTALVSIPVTIFGYRILTRASFTAFATAFLFCNALLLVPVRESLPIGVLAIVALGIPVAMLVGRMQKDITLRTPEGIFAITTLFAPAALILIRSFWLYSVDNLLVLTLSGAAFVALRVSTLQTELHATARSFFNGLSLIAAIMMTGSASALVDHFLPNVFVNSFAVALLSALVLDIANRSQHPLRWVRLSCITLAVGHVLLTLTHDGMISMTLAIIAGAAVTLLGYQYGLRNILLLGTVTILTAFYTQLHPLLGWIDFSSWITLTVLGATIIISASLVERHGTTLLMKWRNFNQVSR
jgi:hypothetical protein